MSDEPILISHLERECTNLIDSLDKFQKRMEADKFDDWENDVKEIEVIKKNIGKTLDSLVGLEK